MESTRKIFEEITNELIREMESNPQAWESGMAFIKSIPVNIENRPYRGLNVVRLCYEQYKKGFEHNKWLTSRKIRFLKGSIKAGEKDSFIVNGDAPYFTPSYVFNIDQVDNLPNQLYESEYSWPIDQAGEKLYHSAECSIIDQHEPTVGYPCYILARDTIYQPPQKYFNSAENYYSTLAHEMVHSTRHESRLNRNRSKYERAYEELIAEMGACFTCATIGIVGNLENHASYLESWIGALKKDNALIFRAAKEAQTAANYLLFRVNKLDKTHP
jgi:antirestriction protein ArdC